MIGARIHYPGSDTTELVKIRHFPATLGRALKNDVTLDHETISAVHCMIEMKDEHYILRDLDSTNGIFLEGEKVREGVIKHHSHFKLGEVEIIFLKDGSDGVVQEQEEKTKEIQTHGHLSHRSSHIPSRQGWVHLLRQVFFLFLFAGIDFYINSGLNSQISGFYTSVFFSFLFSLVLASFCAAFSKLHAGRYRFFEFLLKCNYLVVFLIPVGTFWNNLFFQFGPNAIRDFLEYVASYAILVFVGLQLVPSLFPKLTLRSARRRVCGGVALLMLFLFLATLLWEDETQNYEMSALVSMPLIPQVLEVQANPKDFLKGLDEMNTTIEKYREKQRKETLKQEEKSAVQ